MKPICTKVECYCGKHNLTPPPPPCGCEVLEHGLRITEQEYEIKYCPLHASAPALRDALEECKEYFDITWDAPRSQYELYKKMTTLLASCREKGG